MNFDLVVFDCDGVLVDSERLTVTVEARVLTELGWPITPDEVVRRFVGKSTAHMLAEIVEHIGPDLAAHFDEVSTAEIHRSFDEGLQPVDGIGPLLDTLDAAEIRMCVASSGSHAKMRRTLGLTGLYQRFNGRIFSADDVAHGKPEPDLFLHAAQHMGTEPGRCVVVEDSPFGVQAALAAGMRAYGFSGGMAAPGALAAAGATEFATMADLGEILVRMRG